MKLHTVRRGAGKPLLLVHGLGSSWRAWNPVVDGLIAGGREVIAIDLPGHGSSPPFAGEVTMGALADAVTAFLTENDLLGVDAVGNSMGARLVLELARRGGVLGAVVALDPGGFWKGWEIPYFYYVVGASAPLVRALQPVMPTLTSSPLGRTLLFSLFSAHPGTLPPDLALGEMRSFANTPSFHQLLDNLAHGEKQQGAPAGSLTSPLVIGWGEKDHVCPPQQAARAQALFPDAELFWFPDCGHCPQWDSPDLTTQVILAAIEGKPLPATRRTANRTVATKTRWIAAAGVAAAACVLLVLTARH